MLRSGNIFKCTPEEIEIEEGFNVRTDYGDIEALANSIIQNGIRVPLRGRKKKDEEKMVLTDGHRRYAAVKLAYEKGHTDILIPVMGEPAGNIEDRIIGLVVYNDGKPLTMLEEGEVYKRLVGYGWKAVQIATRVGKSASHIGNCLKLMEITPELKDEIKSGTIAATTVVEQLTDKTPEALHEEIKEVKATSGGKKITHSNLSGKRNSETRQKKLTAMDRLNDALEPMMKHSDENTFIYFEAVYKYAKGDFGLSEMIEIFEK